MPEPTPNDYTDYPEGKNKHGQLDNNRAWEVAHAEKALQDQAAKVRKDVFAKEMTGMTEEEKAERNEWREVMKQHLDRRPFAWDKLTAEDGSQVIVSKVPASEAAEQAGQGINHVSFTEHGMVMLQEQRNYAINSKNESWLNALPELFTRISHAHQDLAERKHMGNNQTLSGLRERSNSDSIVFISPVDKRVVPRYTSEYSLGATLDSANQYFEKKSQVPAPATKPTEIAVF